jgi:hypothetical protein
MRPPNVSPVLVAVQPQASTSIRSCGSSVSFGLLVPKHSLRIRQKNCATSLPSVYGSPGSHDYNLLTEVLVDEGDSNRPLLNQFVRDVLVIDNPSTARKHRLHLYSVNRPIKMISFAPASDPLVTCPVHNLLPVAQRPVHVLNRPIQLHQKHIATPLGYPALTICSLNLAASTPLCGIFRLWKDPTTKASRMMPCNALNAIVLAPLKVTSGEFRISPPIFSLTAPPRKHHRIHHEKPYRCADCPQAFGYPKDLVRHRRCVHSDEPHLRFYCNIPTCKRVFSRKDNYERHMRTRHPPPDQTDNGKRRRQ